MIGRTHVDNPTNDLGIDKKKKNRLLFFILFFFFYNKRPNANILGQKRSLFFFDFVI